MLELTRIYERRGLEPELAQQVAKALTAHDALEAHARDEIGITEISQANPLQAAVASALAFIVGGVLPVIGIFLFPAHTLVYSLAALTVIGLVIVSGFSTSWRCTGCPCDG